MSNDRPLDRAIADLRKTPFWWQRLSYKRRSRYSDSMRVISDAIATGIGIGGIVRLRNDLSLQIEKPGKRSSFDLFMKVIELDQLMGDDDHILYLYDLATKTSIAKRSILATSCCRQLIASKRYSDAINAERFLELRARSLTKIARKQQRPYNINQAIECWSEYLETLLGAGQQERAVIVLHDAKDVAASDPDQLRKLSEAAKRAGFDGLV